MKKMIAMGSVLYLLIAVSSVSASWDNISYSNGTDASNVNGGTNTEGYSYTSVKPVSGDWTANYSLQALINPVNIWSASTIKFDDWSVVPGNAGQSSNFVIRVNLSDPVTSVTWDLPYHYRNIDAGNSLVAKYSTDGINFSTGYTYPTGNGDIDPDPVTFSVPATNALYIGLFGTVANGGSVFYNPSLTGTLTFVPEPATMGLLFLGGVMLRRRKITV